MNKAYTTRYLNEKTAVKRCYVVTIFSFMNNIDDIMALLLKNYIQNTLFNTIILLVSLHVLNRSHVS